MTVASAVCWTVADRRQVLAGRAARVRPFAAGRHTRFDFALNAMFSGFGELLHD